MRVLSAASNVQVRVLVFVLALLGCALHPSELFAVKEKVSSLDSTFPKYGTGTWDSDTLGNHRAVVQAPGAGDAVWAHINWRRRDKNPESKEIILIDRQTGKRVKNVVRISITQESGDLVFQPVSGAGEYDFYIMPYQGNLKSNYPKITYLAPTATADPAWLLRNHLQNPDEAFKARKRMPKADVVRFESIDDFNRFTSLEMIAPAKKSKRSWRQTKVLPTLYFLRTVTIPFV